MVLVAVEGAPGTRRADVVAGVVAQLTKAKATARAVPEYATGPAPDPLLLADPADLLVTVLALVADLYSADVRVIGPALAARQVVVKDRHLDALSYLAGPALVAGRAVYSEARAAAWLRSLGTELHHLPDLVVYLDEALEVRRERLRAAGVGWDQLRTGSDPAWVARTDAAIAEQLRGGTGLRYVVTCTGRDTASLVDEVVDLVTTHTARQLDRQTGDGVTALFAAPGRRRR